MRSKSKVKRQKSKIREVLITSRPEASSQKLAAGYTLIELVIVIMVLLIVGGIVVSIIYFSIRGTTKAKTNNSISQNGNYAMTTVGNFVSNAKELVEVTGSDDVVYTSCVPAVTGVPLDIDEIKIVNQNNEQTVFACSDTTISSNSASLLDLEEVEIVSGTCSMACIQDSVYSPPRIDISFTLKQAGSVENAGSSPFSTSATMRNFGL